MPLDLNLLSQNSIPDLFPWLSNIWSLPKHALVRNDAHGKVVDSDSVVLAAHDLGGHVAGSSGRVFGVVRVPDSGDAEVSEAEVSVFFKYQILRFYVSMDDSFIVDVFEG